MNTNTDPAVLHAHYRALVAARHSILVLLTAGELTEDDPTVQETLAGLLDLINHLEPGQRF